MNSPGRVFELFCASCSVGVDGYWRLASARRKDQKQLTSSHRVPFLLSDNGADNSLLSVHTFSWKRFGSTRWML